MHPFKDYQKVLDNHCFSKPIINIQSRRKEQIELEVSGIGEVERGGDRCIR